MEMLRVYFLHSSISYFVLFHITHSYLRHLKFVLFCKIFIGVPLYSIKLVISRSVFKKKYKMFKNSLRTDIIKALDGGMRLDNGELKNLSTLKLKLPVQ